MILRACGCLFRKMDHVTNIYAILGKAYMHLGASAMFMSDLSKLLAAASVAAAAAASLRTTTILCSRK